jgi:CheY-like chemotaxis protein
VGRLAGGIAHDFNNLTTPIISYAQLGASLVPSTDPLHEYLLEIRKAGERAAQLTHQLLAFSRSQVIEPRIVDVNQLILNVDRMVRRILGENIELVFLPGEDLGLINVDPAQMEQVVMNLVVNARDAMPGGGRIIISTSDIVLDDEYARSHPYVVAGEHVVLTVSDTGVGITEDVKEHIFEPFFTTKEVGDGTGLGLSTCFGIVAQMGGHITIDSEPGNGATFAVYLPRATGQSVEEWPEDGAKHAPGGSETVMIVEDEVAVLKVAGEVLRQRGYTVLEASNGHEAIWLAQEPANEKIDLLVTDVVMPLMGGTQLATRMSDLHPETSVLFTSGYPSDHLLDEGLQYQNVQFLPKPYTQDSLTSNVRQALESQK